MAEYTPTSQASFQIGRKGKIFCGYGDFDDEDTVTIPQVRFCHCFLLTTVEDGGADSSLPLVKAAVAAGDGTQYVQATITGAAADDGAADSFSAYWLAICS